MEDYKAKYEQALRRAKKFWEAEYKGVAEEIFPELKESDDERIRKEIMDIIDSFEVAHLRIAGLPTKIPEYLAWLEKQVENNPYSGVSFKYNGHTYGMCARDNGVDILLDKQLFKHLEKQGENITTLPKWKYKKDNAPLLRDSLILNKYGCVAKSPSGALVSDVWVIDYDELAKLPKEEFEKQGEQKSYASETMNEKGDFDSGFTRMMEKEQKPWSEEDDQYLLVCKNALAKYQVSDKWDATIISRWLEDKVKSSVQQPKQGWSKKDERILDEIIHTLNERKCIRPFLGEVILNEYIDWLKYLRHQSHWKPTEEQMNAIKDAIIMYEGRGINAVGLKGLLEQLKKLKEE